MPPPTARTQKTVAPPPSAKMHVGAEVTIHGGRRAYLAEDATWLQTEKFCEERESRLCRYEELCPEVISTLSDEVHSFFCFHLAQSHISFPQHKNERWAPVLGPAHNWMEVGNCGMTLWPGLLTLHPNCSTIRPRKGFAPMLGGNSMSCPRHAPPSAAIPHGAAPQRARSPGSAAATQALIKPSIPVFAWDDGGFGGAGRGGVGGGAVVEAQTR
jgi:hypothetical protein